MSSKSKTPAMKNDGQPTFTPKLRFPEFRNADGWEETPLQKIARPVSDRAVTGDGDNVLSLSGEHGLVLQSDYFGKKVAGDSAERYLKLVRNDFVYNDRTTKASVYGTIKRLSKYDGGIVSPIYKCFRFDGCETPEFWEWYFEAGAHESQLGSLVNEGARAGRFNISISQFLSISVWRPEELEQQMIADCLTSVDEVIAAQARKVDALKAHKKGLMQELFPREGETQPRLRFPEFQDAEEWDMRKLGKVAENLDNRRVPITSSDRVAGDVPYYGASGVVDYVDGYIFDEDLLCVSEDGANLVARTYPIAFPISGKTWVNNHAHVLRFENPCTQKFVEVYLNSIKLDDFITGMAQPKLNKAMLDSIPIPHPDMPEQQRIADCLTSLDDLIAAQAQKLDVHKTHKDGLMQQLFPFPEGVEA
jgi:type I restriction enzyme S subunit